MKDENELLQAGELPADPADGTERMETPPGKGWETPLESLHLAGFLADAAARMRRRKEEKERPIATPWPELNTALRGGLWPGLVVLAGNSGTGKTQFALQAALHAAKKQIPALYVGLELDELGFAARLMALEYRQNSKVPVQWSDLYVGRDPAGSDTANPKLDDVIDGTKERLAELPLYLELGPPGGWPVSALDARVIALRKQHPKEKGPCLVVLDFLQIIGHEENERAELRERIGKAAYEGRRIAREHDAVVILVSSTARDKYLLLQGRNGKGQKETDDAALGKSPPGRFLGVGKESGEIEYAADVALTLCREQWEKDKPPPPVHLAVAKVRAGVPAWVGLEFDGCVFGEAKKGGEYDGRW